jgi:hypothetical protein
MTISDQLHVAQADAVLTTDREARLRPAAAILAIVLLASVSWGIVVMVAVGLHSAF